LNFTQNRYIILAPAIAEMLADLDVVFSKFGIDFYLVGAVARDINLSANKELTSTRGTKDCLLLGARTILHFRKPQKN